MARDRAVARKKIGRAGGVRGVGSILDHADFWGKAGLSGCGMDAEQIGVESVFRLPRGVESGESQC